jgi:NADH:flavin oxidoreductase / NADH oxidase family
MSGAIELDGQTKQTGLFDAFEAPMEKNLCTSDGVMTQRYIDYLVARAHGGVGLLRVEATYVDPVGKGRPFQCGAHSDHVIPELMRMTDAVHRWWPRSTVASQPTVRSTRPASVSWNWP